MGRPIFSVLGQIPIKPKLLQSDPPLGGNPWQGPCDDSIQQSVFSQYGSSQAEEFQVSKQSQLSHLSLLETGEYSQLAHSASQASSVLRKLVFQTEFQNCFTFIPCLFQPQPSMMLLSTSASQTQHALKLPHLSDLNLAYQDSPSCGSLTLCDMHENAGTPLCITVQSMV